jgi:hypothetical protein
VSETPPRWELIGFHLVTALALRKDGESLETRTFERNLDNTAQLREYLDAFPGELEEFNRPAAEAAAAADPPPPPAPNRAQRRAAAKPNPKAKRT